MTADSSRLEALLRQLTLDEKVLLVSGETFWTTVPIERIGLRAMVLSDGPSGVRGSRWDERLPSLSLPSATALAASWDPQLAYRYGAVAAAEARRKGVDVVLGPTINLHRSPLGGRHFEAFSEDPLLSGVLAAAYVRGLQDNGVAATPKHYVANDSETERFTVDVRLDERVLRELYLLPFELAVEAGAWAIMVAYNSIDGVTMTENDLLERPLVLEWGFDGATISDWTAVRGIAAAGANMDLAMPGPETGWSGSLAQAVRDGRVSESVVDRKVLNLLTLADRVGALSDSDVHIPATVDGVGFARQAAVDGTVLLRNTGQLPWDPTSLTSIAVIGQYARSPRIQGGGSATVIPQNVVSPLDGISSAAPNLDVRFAIGAIVQEGVEEFPLSQITDPHTGTNGVRVAFLDDEGIELFSEHRESTSLVWFDGDVPLAASRTIVLETLYTPLDTDDCELGFASSKRGRVLVGGEVVLDAKPAVEGDDLAASLLAPPSATVTLPVYAGVGVALRAEFSLSPDDPLAAAVSVRLGRAPRPESAGALIAQAVEAARSADVAVVVVGTNAAVESEGFDRTTLDLPGHQDELVRAVAAANPRTVVVVYAGAPVHLPWRGDVDAVLLGYFAGQEVGSALADMLFGKEEPGGRLPTTWPGDIGDVPVLDVTPSHGVLDYSEGLDIGYRAWLRSDREPAFPFGWGLGYTTWALAGLEAGTSLADSQLELTVGVTNTGSRRGKHVVQAYAERQDTLLDRPARWLIGSVVVVAEPGETVRARIPIRARAFAHWHGSRTGNWVTEAGEFTIRVGSSVLDVPLSTQWNCEAMTE